MVKADWIEYKTSSGGLGRVPVSRVTQVVSSGVRGSGVRVHVVGSEGGFALSLPVSLSELDRCRLQESPLGVVLQAHGDLAPAPDVASARDLVPGLRSAIEGGRLGEALQILETLASRLGA